MLKWIQALAGVNEIAWQVQSLGKVGILARSLPFFRFGRTTSSPRQNRPFDLLPPTGEPLSTKSFGEVSQ